MNINTIYDETQELLDSHINWFDDLSKGGSGTSKNSTYGGLHRIQDRSQTIDRSNSNSLTAQNKTGIIDFIKRHRRFSNLSPDVQFDNVLEPKPTFA